MNMKKILFGLLALVFITGTLLACGDDPPVPGNGEGTAKPTAPGKPTK